MHPVPAIQNPRKLQLPKNPGADARALQGGPPRALPGGVVPGARGEQEEDGGCRLVAQRRAALTSRIAEQKRLCRTRWRACSFCGGSSPLRWSRSRSSTARDTSVGRGRARRHSQRHQDAKKHREMRPETQWGRVRVNADRPREGQPSTGQTPAELPVSGRECGRPGALHPEDPHTHPGKVVEQRAPPPQPFSLRTLPHPQTAGLAAPRHAHPRRVRPPTARALRGQGRGPGSETHAAAGWAGPPDALTSL